MCEAMIWCVCAREQGLSHIDCFLHVHVCARLSVGVRVRVRVRVRAALGCVDALQSSGIVPIVEKVRGLIKNAWSPDISHRPAAASRDGQSSESSSTMGWGL